VIDRWHFAYGSNLSKHQKMDRTGPIREARRARLGGYRIAFNKRGSDGTGKANIVPDPRGTVWGVVYRCNPDALSAMDKREGVSAGHYVRMNVSVAVHDDEDLSAITYVAGSTFIDNLLTPNPGYLQTILEGAREHGLPENYICRLEALGVPT